MEEDTGDATPNDLRAARGWPPAPLLVQGHDRATGSTAQLVGRLAGRRQPVPVQAGAARELVAAAVVQHGGRVEEPAAVGAAGAVAEQVVDALLVVRSRGAPFGSD